MNEANSKILTDKYPLTFALSADRGHPFTFECGDGWFQILDELCAKIEEMIRPFADDPEVECGFVPHVNQIKEKHGTLRFYMSSSTDAMEEAIDDACDKSANTCESCGEPGEFYDSGWCMVRCPKCK